MKTHHAVAQLPSASRPRQPRRRCRQLHARKSAGPATNPCSIFLRSVPQIPQAATRISTSPAPIAGTGTVSTTTLPLPRYTAARIVDGTGCAAREVSRMIPDWLIARPPYPARWESAGRPWFPQTRPENPQDAATQTGESRANFNRSGKPDGLRNTCERTPITRIWPCASRARSKSYGISKSAVSLMARIATAGTPHRAASARIV